MNPATGPPNSTLNDEKVGQRCTLISSMSQAVTATPSCEELRLSLYLKTDSDWVTY